MTLAIGFSSDAPVWYGWCRKSVAVFEADRWTMHVNCSDQFIVKVREIARECKKLLIRERPDVALGCIQQE